MLFMHRIRMMFSLVLLLFCLAPAPFVDSAMDFGDDEPEPDMPVEMPGYSANQLREMAKLVQRTGVGFDRIPALQRPNFISISDANLSMDNDEVVFVIHYPNNRVRIYPQRILVWHEIVNDVLPDETATLPRSVPGVNEAAGESYTLSYSPLTGSVVAFRSMAGKYPTTYGVTGTLLNGNSIVYDRISHSLWDQLMSVCVEGPFFGKRLERIQVTWARWSGVKERYGGLHSQFTGTAEVLSRATGHRRSYGKDPYGSYQTSGSYYDNNRLPFAVSHLDPRLPPKKRILGIELDTAFGAILIDEVKESQVLNFTLGVTPMVAIYDSEMDSVRIFERTIPGRTSEVLTFTLFEGKLIDEQTRTEWFATGMGVYGPLRERKLKEVLSVDSMWFAWASFYRGTQIFPGKQW